jgi:hypothetical protein
MTLKASIAPVKLGGSLVLLEGPKKMGTYPHSIQREESKKIKDPTPAEIIISLLKKDENDKYINAFEVISSPQMLKLAYEVIKSKPGNMVKGTNHETLDGITSE